MKNIIVSFVLVFSLLVPSLLPAHAATIADDRLVGYAAYGNKVAFFNKNAIFLYNMTTKESKEIGSNDNGMGYAGITVLSDGVYWVENIVAPAIHKYSFDTGLATTIETFNSFGTLEKSCPVGVFQMLNSSQVLYILESSAAIDPDSVNQPCNGYGTHVFDLNTHKMVTNKELFSLTGDESKVTSENLISSYEIVGTLDGKRTWGFYQGYRPGATKATIDTMVNYYRLREVGGASPVTAPYSTVNSGDAKYSVLTNLRYPLVADVAQGRVILSKEKKTGANYLVYNTNSNTTHKDLGTNFVSPAYDQASNIQYVRANNLNVLTENTSSKELYYYNAVTDTSCTVSGSGYVTVRDFITASLPSSKAQVVHNGQILRFSADSNTVVSQPICVAGTNQPVSNPAQTPVKNSPIVAPLATGVLIKATNNPSVYFYGGDGKRYVFYNEDIFKTWYSNFSGVKSISPAQMAAIKIGGNVTYRPGTLVKISSDPVVYAVDKSGVLRALASETIARSLYGSSWARQIKTIPDFLFSNYQIGDPISSTGDFNPSEVKAWVKDINTDKNL